MAVRTWEAFFELLEKSGMLRGDRFKQAVTLTRDLTEPTTIARRLVNDGLLSRWQAAQLLSGQDVQFLGKYKLLDELESTATSRVYLAEHCDMDRRVALKTLPRRHNSDAAEVRQFQADVAAVASLNHPAINHIYDVDCEAGNYYLIMEYSDGRTLDEVVRADGPLDDITAARYIWQVAQGLAHAHQHGIVHHDIRPSKLVVTPHGTIKILEMGLRKLADSELDSFGDPSQMRAEQVDYMAPELATAKPSEDPRTDLYGLGCSLYFALTGGPTFPEGSAAQRLQQHVSAAPPDILALRPDADPALAELAHKMMAKRPDERPSSAHEVAEAFHALTSEYERKVNASHAQARAVASKARASASAVLPLDLDSETESPDEISIEPTHTKVTSSTAVDPDAVEQSSRLPWVLGGAAGGLLLLTALVVAIVSWPTTAPDAGSLKTDSGHDRLATTAGGVALGGKGSADGSRAQDTSLGSSSPAITQPAREPQGGLIGHWDFKDKFKDCVGEFDGVPGGAGADVVSDPENSKSDKVLSLDGMPTAVVTVGPIDKLGDAITVSAWVRLSADRAADRVSVMFSDWDTRSMAGRQAFLRLGIDSRQYPFIRVAPPERGVQQGTLVTAPKVVKPDDGWVHIAFTAEVGNEIRLYRDGIVAGRKDYTYEHFPATRRSFVIGNDISGKTENAFHGWLDDVRIYDRALSAAEIGQLFDETKGTPTANAPPPEATQFARWTMKRLTVDKVAGSKGKPAGKLVGKKLSQTDGAVLLDGNENFVQVKNLKLRKTNRVSFTAWVRGNPTGDRTGIIVSRGAARNKSASSLTLTADRKLGYIWGQNNKVADVSSDLRIPEDQWAFVAMAVEPKRAKLFVWTEDDKLKFWDNETAHDELEIVDLEIGRDSVAKDRYFQGYVADVRVYTGVLDDKSIKQIVNSTKGGLPDVSQPAAPAASTGQSSPNPPPKTDKPTQSREPYPHESDFVALKPRAMRAKGGMLLEAREDNSIFATVVDRQTREAYEITFDTADTSPEMNCITAVRFEALPDDLLPAGGPGYGSAGDFSISELRVAVAPRDAPDKRQYLRLVDPRSSDPSSGAPKYAVDGNLRRHWISKARRGKPISATFRIAEPLDCASGSLLFVIVQTEDRQGRFLGHFRMSASTASPKKLGLDSARSSQTAEPAAKLFRRFINCGGGPFTHPQGNEWAKHGAFKAGGFGHVGGKREAHEDRKNPVTGTCWREMKAFRFTVPNGVYELTLVFADHWTDQAGKRRFAVGIEGKTALPNLDLFQVTGGKGRLWRRTFPSVPVTDGVLDIDFKASQGAAMISAISLIQQRPLQRGKKASSRR